MTEAESAETKAAQQRGRGSGCSDRGGQQRGGGRVCRDRAPRQRNRGSESSDRGGTAEWQRQYMQRQRRQCNVAELISAVTEMAQQRGGRTENM